MPRALVTGGAGFIGSNLVLRLLTAGYNVIVLDDLSSGYEENLAGLAVDLVRGDVRDESAVNDAARGVDSIFHLAASVGNIRSIEHPVTDSEINVIGTLRVLEAARRHDIAKVVYSSSAGIFGELKDLPIVEDHPIDPDSPYGVSKLAGEKMCVAYSKLYGIDIACLRYFNVYGPSQRFDAYGNVIPIFGHQLLTGEPLTIFSDGEQTRDFVHVDDVTRANQLAAETPGVAGAYNIASGSAITINRLVELLSTVSGIDAVVQYGPPRPGDVRDSLADTSAAQQAFGYRSAVSIDDGLRDYMSWLSREYATRP